jgi:hypothetical protein
MDVKCFAGNCAAFCERGCYCISSSKNPDWCYCDCELVYAPANEKGKKPTNYTTKGGKKTPFNKNRQRIKVIPGETYNICAHSVPITMLAQSLDKVLPNRILIPANKVTKKVNLHLENKTLRQIIIATGLSLRK